MSNESANQFVLEMRENEAFRRSAVKAATSRDLPDFLKRRDYTFELRHLVLAMAACMEELASFEETTIQ